MQNRANSSKDAAISCIVQRSDSVCCLRNGDWLDQGKRRIAFMEILGDWVMTTGQDLIRGDRAVIF